MEREKERAVAILDRRTAALAGRAAVAASRATPRRAVIVWALGEGLGGLDVSQVAAVMPFAGCAPVPSQSAACLGLIGRGGRVYSVLGLRALAGSVAASPAEGSQATERPAHLLLLRGAPPLALAVDRVLGRFDLADTGDTLDLGGRLVAMMDPAALRAGLGSAQSARSP